VLAKTAPPSSRSRRGRLVHGEGAPAAWRSCAESGIPSASHPATRDPVVGDTTHAGQSELDDSDPLSQPIASPGTYLAGSHTSGPRPSSLALTHPTT
jgi:hypothetical protein